MSAQVGGRCSGHHISGVLDVPGGVGNDELALGGGKVTVGGADRDPLFAFGPKAVGQQGEVDVFVPSFLLLRFFDGFKLILEDRLGVMKESTDKGALPVVHAARGGEPQEIHVQVIVFFSH